MGSAIPKAFPEARQQTKFVIITHEKKDRCPRTVGSILTTLLKVPALTLFAKGTAILSLVYSLGAYRDKSF